jgi:hypothetical protein
MQASSPLKDRRRSEGEGFCVRSRRRTGSKPVGFVEDSVARTGILRLAKLPRFGLPWVRPSSPAGQESLAVLAGNLLWPGRWPGRATAQQLRQRNGLLWIHQR